MSVECMFSITFLPGVRPRRTSHRRTAAPAPLPRPTPGAYTPPCRGSKYALTAGCARWLKISRQKRLRLS
jgi:hypothetical protein